MISLLATVLLGACPAWGQTSYIVDDDGPADFSTISDALVVAVSGDTIVVRAGDYVENIALKTGVDILGEGGSEVTFLRGTGTGSVVNATHVSDAQLSGFTISGGGSLSHDAGVKIYGGSPLIRNNLVENNTNGFYLHGDSLAVIESNTISDNGDTSNASLDYGIVCLHANATIVNNLVAGNPETGVYIGWEDSSNTNLSNNTIVDNGNEGIWCYRASAIIKNNVIVGNDIGILASSSAAPTIENNDVWNNTSADYHSLSGGTAGPGPGDISSDPLFDPALPGLYRLSAGSPCIDTGDSSVPGLPATDIHGDTRIIDGDGDSVAVVDMGADEFLPGAPPWGTASTFAGDDSLVCSSLACLLIPFGAFLLTRFACRKR